MSANLTESRFCLPNLFKLFLERLEIPNQTRGMVFVAFVFISSDGSGKVGCPR